MGQYYLLVNLDKRQYLEPWAFGSQAKFSELATDSYGPMMALAFLLASGLGSGGLESDDAFIGSWAGDRIVIAGDYAEDGEWLTEEDWARYAESHGDPKPNLYDFAKNTFENVSLRTVAVLAQDAWMRRSFARRMRGSLPLREQWERDLPAPVLALLRGAEDEIVAQERAERGAK